MWEFCVLLDARYCFEVSFESVDQAPSSFNFTFSDIFPDVDITLTRGRQEVPVISENEYIEDLLIRISEILVLTDEPTLIAKLIN